jgi:hypothetical protein
VFYYNFRGFQATSDGDSRYNRCVYKGCTRDVQWIAAPDAAHIRASIEPAKPP